MVCETHDATITLGCLHFNYSTEKLILNWWYQISVLEGLHFCEYFTHFLHVINFISFNIALGNTRLSTACGLDHVCDMLDDIASMDEESPQTTHLSYLEVVVLLFFNNG